MTCAACKHQDAARVTLIDGSECCTWCESWRHECEARAVLAMPKLSARRDYLYGVPELSRGITRMVGGIKKKRGDAAVKRLEETMTALWRATAQPAAGGDPCAPRKRFATRDQAQVAAHSIAVRNGEHRLPDACSKCNGWHLANDNQQQTRKAV